jgi:methionine sulfoxide reductase heme-binding subunit
MPGELRLPIMVSMQPATRSSNQPLGGASGGWHRRLLRFHLPLALASAVVIFLWMTLPLFQPAGQHGRSQVAGQETNHQRPPQIDGAAAGQHGRAQGTGRQGPSQASGTTPLIDHSRDQPANLDGLQNRLFMARFTTATGYVALGLLALTLLIGPANLLLRKRNPVSSYLRRDVGTWTAVVTVVHVIAGFFVHGPAAPFGERILRYFFTPDGRLLTNSFGLGNWTGLAATVIVMGLLAISNDFALGKLKARPWKNLQRLNYGLFALVIAHALYYGAGLRVTSPSTILLGLLVIAVFAGQVVGVGLWQRRHARTGV